jgi:hypothetical protein
MYVAMLPRAGYILDYVPCIAYSNLILVVLR